MKNFIFYAPTKIVFGKDTQSKTGKLVKEFGGKKVLIHYGGESAKKSGLLQQIKESLIAENIEFLELGGVIPNPALSKIREGIKICKRENVDFVLAVGGGSVIDSAKAIAIGSANDCDVWDFYSPKKKATPTKSLKVASVLTIAAAGSEMSAVSVVTNDEDGLQKRSCTSELFICKFAIMNPELTMTLPPYQTSSGCVDIIVHTLERYFNNQTDTQLQDALAEALIRTVIEFAKVLVNNPNDYNARAQIMWASSISHNDVTGNRFLGDWACHQLEHELSGMFAVAHGAGLSAIWGAWAHYVCGTNPSRFAKLGRNVFDIKMDSDIDAAQLCILAFERFFKAINMPTSISKLGVELNQKQIDELAYKCSFENTRTIGAFQVLDENDIKKIYTMAR